MPRPEFEIQVISTDKLPDIEQDWELLAKHALEPNPFYERWMLAPALNAVGMKGDIRVALIWFRDSPKRSAVLAGLLPFTYTQRWKGLPASASANLTHIYCSSGVPLLHHEHSRAALDAYFDWLNSPSSHCSIMSFRVIPVDGQFHQLLVDVLHSRSLVYAVERRYTRAFYRPPADPAKYVAVQFSGRTLKHLRRQKELLSEQGTLEFRHLGPRENATEWIDEFLRLEGSGWKGAEGTALGSVGSHAAFFRGVTRAAQERERLKMSGLLLNGRFVAARTAFRTGDGSYLFKIAYDETYARYSPGMLLEMECIIAGNGSSDGWEDSCTSPENAVYKRLWQERRTIEDIVVSSGSAWGDLSLSVLPCLRFVKARVMRRVSNAGTSRQPPSAA